MQDNNRSSHGVTKQFPMDIAPKMKLIKPGVWDVKAKHHAILRLNPHPKGGEGVHEGCPT